jgi:hypothetical protein
VTADTPPMVQARLVSWQSGDVKDADDPSDAADALGAAAHYRVLGDAFQQGKMLLRAGASQLTQAGGEDGAQSGELLLREARDLLALAGNTKSLAHCLSALASARLFADDMATAQELHGEALAVMRNIATPSRASVATGNRL